MAYPTTPAPAFGFEIEKHYNVLISEFDSGVEQRRRMLRFPKRKFHLQYNNISLTDRNTLSNYYQTMNGPYTAFYVFDWSSRTWTDEYVTQTTGTSSGPFDIHGKEISTGTFIVYYDSVATTKFVFYSSSGTDGSACIVSSVTSIPSSGTLITCDLDGKLRIKGRFETDFSFKESAGPRGRFTCVIDLTEVQW